MRTVVEITKMPWEKDFTELTKREKMVAYKAIKETFDLKAAQRDKLDISSYHETIIAAAHNMRWAYVAQLLVLAQIVEA